MTMPRLATSGTTMFTASLTKAGLTNRTQIALLAHDAGLA
jgi:hypothetical protein